MSYGDIVYKKVIEVAPITKKNHQEIFFNKQTHKPFITTSPQYKQYLQDCAWYLNTNRPKQPIDFPVNVQTVFYMPTARRVDLSNLIESIHDVLVHCEVLGDDNFKVIESVNGSRVFVDKEHPRTEIIITDARVE